MTYLWRFKVVASSFMLTIHLSILQASQSVKFKLSVLSWPQANFLILNLEKMKIMLVGTHQSTAEADNLVLEISNTRLERVNKFKYLGVLLNNTLSWKDHIEYIGNKISPYLFCVERVRFFPSQLVKCSPIL